ncbi:MAG: sensor histidine kinase [Alphaproteobacteria bacterium]|nr:sensor histidine kinase [Alphaproteobacteria bacterium]
MGEPTTRTAASDIRTVAGIDAVPAILEVVCRATGLRFAAVARVTDDNWTACAVRDELAFGLEPGDELEIATTLCDEVRGRREAIVIDHVDQDPDYCGHATPRMYGFQSYISMPIFRRNGEFFGTLCALDPLPARVSDPTVVATFRLFAELLGMHLDNRERMASTEAALLDERETAELREHFIAVLGHDLRNPLAAVEAGTRILSRMELDPQAASVVGRMQESCRRMGGLIGDLLDFARGRLGGGLPMALALHEDVGERLELVVAELRAVHPGRLIQARLDLRQPIRCDAARLAQLLSNLLANALTHGAADGPVRVAASVAEGALKLCVANGGPRIAPAKRARLFQPFTRGEAGTRPEGLGLGLYIASEIARAHGGRLEVESSDKETAFTLVMPVEAGGEEPAEEMPALAMVAEG